MAGRTESGGAAALIAFLLWGADSTRVTAFTNPAEGLFRSDGTAADTQAAIYAAPDGSVIEIPEGEFVWTRPVRTTGKPVHIRGAGGGAIWGHSETACAIGSGLRELHTGATARLSPGQSLRVIYTPHGERWLEGTVTSCQGERLVIEATSSAGGGTYAFWCLATAGKTRILNRLAKGAALELGLSSRGLTEVSNLHFQAGEGNTWATNHVTIHGTRGGKGFRIHHCRFSTNGDLGRAVEVRTLGGLLDNCGFDQGFDAGPGNGLGNDDQAIGFKAELSRSSWTRASTMGALDVEGTANTYVEDCYFVGFWTQCLDFDDNSRTVVRYCVFDHSGCASHGADTSPAGNRHFELYDNEFLFRDVGPDTFNVTWLLFLRGGTGVVTGNAFPDLRSQSWGDKPELNFTVMNLRRRAGPYPCWKSGWPAPHQIGQGHDGKGTICEPVYIWTNSGPGNETPGISDYEPNDCGELAHRAADYLQSGRDFIVGTAKPGYAKFRYPHPFRAAQNGAKEQANSAPTRNPF